ncbi:MAG TPA: membrane protein insertase YidC [Mesorhizobium sp.]|jgi:YidC/Oxa1 family membrane protein insertase|nr:membrane protein insertase YidC [Mesorhizobium sp.]
MENNRNFFITIALSILILTVWQVFYMNPRLEKDAARIEAERVAAQETGAAPGSPANENGVLPSPGAAAVVPGLPGTDGAAPQTREAALGQHPRVPIDTPSLTGSINLRGARIDDLRLKDYRLTVEPDSPLIELLNPAALPNGYYAEVGYVAGAGAGGPLPGPDTLWRVEGANQTLTPATPVTLVHDNGQGLVFRRTIAVDADYMFTVSDQVTNAGQAAAALSNYGRVTRFDKPSTPAAYVLHEGLIGVSGEEGLQEIDYGTIEEDRQIAPAKSTDGWLGITDKYWAAALAPSGRTPFQPSYKYIEANGRTSYQSDYLADPLTIAPGETQTVETQLFAGAKEVAIVDRYQEERGIRQFELLIDWGWFYFITKPMFWLIDALFRFFGNFGVAILATTVVVKAVFFPLANKSYASMARMKAVQPKLMEIRDKFADDKLKQQQAMMELYKTEKINPLAGCWPVLIQIPVFFALYKVLYVTIEMRHAPFFGWIQDLAAPDPTSIFNLFGLLPFAVPAFLMIGVWPIIMGITMWLQMRMNPTPPDPTQAMIFNWMPLVFTFMLATFPAGLVIYWAWNNTLSIVQQGIIMKRQGAKIELWDNLAGVFRKKPTPAE